MQRCIDRLTARSSTALVKLRIYVSLMQVIEGMGIAMAIPWPPLFDGLLSALIKVIFFLRIEYLPADCVLRIDLLSRLVINTLLPIALYASLNVISAVLRKCGTASPQPAERAGHVESVSLLNFLSQETAKYAFIFLCACMVLQPVIPWFHLPSSCPPVFPSSCPPAAPLQLLLQQGRWAEAEGAASCGVARLAEWAVARTLR